MALLFSQYRECLTSPYSILRSSPIVQILIFSHLRQTTTYAKRNTGLFCRINLVVRFIGDDLKGTLISNLSHWPSAVIHDSRLCGPHKIQRGDRHKTHPWIWQGWSLLGYGGYVGQPLSERENTPARRRQVREILPKRFFSCSSLRSGEKSTRCMSWNKQRSFRFKDDNFAGMAGNGLEILHCKFGASRIIGWAEGQHSGHLPRNAGDSGKAQSTTKESCYYSYWKLDLLG
jgi:hypothetical protein